SRLHPTTGRTGRRPRDRPLGGPPRPPLPSGLEGRAELTGRPRPCLRGGLRPGVVQPSPRGGPAGLRRASLPRLRGPLMPPADASVRSATVNDAPAVGHVQALVWQEAYDGIVPPQVHAAFDPQAFATAWRDSLRTPPDGVHRLLVAC